MLPMVYVDMTPGHREYAGDVFGPMQPILDGFAFASLDVGPYQGLLVSKSG